jgi:glycosyltransferase involved in cell wall biosynthesis
MRTMQTRRGKEVSFEVDEDALKALIDLSRTRGETFPRIGVLVISYNASDLVADTLRRIPPRLLEVLTEVFVFDDASSDDTYEKARELLRGELFRDKLRVYRNPKNMGYGGNQKIGFQYAVDCGFDYLVLLHGDGQYAPELLPRLLLPMVTDGEQVVFGSRMARGGGPLKGGMPLYKWLGNRLLTRFENAVLGLELTEYHSGFRVYATSVLNRIRFHENTDDFHFDSQIIVQLRALGVNIREVPIGTFYGDEISRVNGLRYAFDVCRSVVEYRLHQLHVIRRSRYYLKTDVVYTRKESPYGSHQQILSQVAKEGLALDLGSAMGLLTEDLLARGVASVGVDVIDPEKVQASFLRYVRADLEQPSRLEFEREFDYVILGDVIEHLRNAEELLRRVHAFLKVDGLLIVSVPNIAIWFYRLSLFVGRFNYGDKGILDRTHVRLYTLDTICDLLVACGFVVREVGGTSLPFEVVFESTGNSRVLKLVDRLYAVAVRVWPRLFAYQIVVTAEISSLRAEKGEGQVTVTARELKELQR